MQIFCRMEGVRMTHAVKKAGGIWAPSRTSPSPCPQLSRSSDWAKNWITMDLAKGIVQGCREG
jgi:hypothetical protein